MSLLSNHHQEDRPWGSFEQFTLNEPSTVKILHVDAGKRFSLQKHVHRSEYWKVIEGNGIAHINDEERNVGIGDTIEIPAGTLHRLTGGENGISVLEIAFGPFDESDIERLEDDFGRT
jgi:mannose-6-phosphate isomerase